MSQEVDGKIIFTRSFWTFYDIPEPGKYGFSRSINLDIIEENLSNPGFCQRNLNLNTLPHSPKSPSLINKSTKGNRFLLSIGFEHKLHNRRDKNCFFLGLDLISLDWEPAVITCRLKSDIMVLLQFYISIQKVLEQPWWYFPFLKLCKCSWILHPLPRVASTPNRTKTNHYWLDHLQALHTLNYTTTFKKGQSRSFPSLVSH